MRLMRLQLTVDGYNFKFKSLNSNSCFSVIVQKIEVFHLKIVKNDGTGEMEMEEKKNNRNRRK